ncbi:LexA family transcriptional regulator [Burkholderia sp. LMG 13014]|uniref:XRE family transcriptional regulator n=1 Tax=Burkholderia sp. LMG 13014 TaxID=2709306 RepID=UPI0019625F39|nr:LexA family transcriptional regulator [Burkholderia sp. LMG 13014]
MADSEKGLATRLQHARMSQNITQAELARRAGVSQSTIANVESGRNAGTKFLVPLADALGVHVRWLLEGRGPVQVRSSDKPGSVVAWETPADLPHDTDRVWIDRYDYRFSAGNGHIQWEIREKNALPFNTGFFRAIGSKPDDCRLVDVVGDSMSPFLFDRDMMMVDMSKRDPRDGKIYAVLFEEEPLVKQIFRQPGGALMLHSFNPRYPDRILKLEHLEFLQIVGQCVYRSGSTINI